MPFARQQAKLDYLYLLNMAATLILFFSIITPVSAKEILAESKSLTELITNLINNVGEAVDQNISNKEGFKSDFARWYSETSARLEDVLRDMGLIINDYAESDKEFDVQHKDLVNDFSSLKDELGYLISTYPQLAEVLQIVAPHVYEFEDVIKSEFPTLGPYPDSGNPFGHYFEYYQKVEAQDPLETGTFFRIEFIPDDLGLKFFQEQVIETTVAGIKEKTVVYRETTEVSNNVLVFFEVIEDDQVVEIFKKLEDFSVFHGLPSQMRADGVNENMVLFIEEMINLINLKLVQAYNEQGLDIPINHPQIVVPEGYTTKIFEQNFTHILEDLAEEYS